MFQQDNILRRFRRPISGLLAILALTAVLAACAPSAAPVAPAAPAQAAAPTEAPAPTAAAIEAPAQSAAPTEAPASTAAPIEAPAQAAAPTEAPVPTEAPTEAPAQAAAVSFAKDVQPILEQRCLNCHGGKDGIKGGLSMKTYNDLMKGGDEGAVILPGDPANSLLVKLIDEGEMPKRASRLPQGEIDVISAWVAAGAKND